MHRYVRYRLYPTVRQVNLLTQLLSDSCDLYNAALQERKENHRASFATQCSQLKDLRIDEQYSRWPANCQHSVLRKLDRAFQGFFRRVKNGQAPGFPRFRSHFRYDSVELPKHGDGYKIVYTNGKFGKFYIKGIGYIKLRTHRDFDGEIRNSVVKRVGNKWYAVVCLKNTALKIYPRTGAIVGVDMATGANGLGYTSDGLKIENPQYLKNNANKLAKQQRSLSRKSPGSNRRKKQVRIVSKTHNKIAANRRTYLHLLTTQMVRDYDYIAIEQLKIGNMVRKPKPKPDPDKPGEYLPNGRAAKSGLSKSILDSGWGYFRDMLVYKAEEAGKQVVLVDPKNTSRTCAHCSVVDKDSRNGKQFICTSCGHTDDADINAAKNILRAGLALQPLL